MYCNKCNSAVGPDDLFCEECGSAIVSRVNNIEEQEVAVAKESEEEQEVVVAREPEEKEAAVARESEKEQEIVVAREPEEEQEVAVALEQEEQEVEEQVEPQDLEDQQEPKTNKPKKLGKGKKIGIVFGIVVGLILLCIGSLVGYSQMATYEIKDTKMDLAEYTNENYNDMFLMNGNTVELNLPKEFLNGYLTQVKKESKKFLGNGLSIEAMAIDVDNQMLMINGKWKGFNLPIGIGYDLNVESKVLSVKNVSLGKGNLPIPKAIVGKIIGNDKLAIDLGGFLPQVVEITEFKSRRGNIELELEFSYKAIKEQIGEMRQKYDSTVVSLYAKNGSGVEQLMGRLLSEGTEVTDDLLNQIFQTSNKELILNANLVCLKEEELTKLEERFGSFLEYLPYTNGLVKLRESAIQSLIQESANTVFSAMDRYDDYNIVTSNMGLPYNRDTHQFVTIDLLIEEGYANESAKMFSHILWNGHGESTLIYENGQKHLQVNRYGDTEPIEKDALVTIEENLQKVAQCLDENHSERIEIMDVLRDQTGAYWVRYLSSDQDHAFVIASSYDFTDTINQYLLEKTSNGWEVLHSYNQNEEVVPHVLSHYPEVNLGILPLYEVANYYVDMLSYEDYKYLEENIYYATDLLEDQIQIEFASMTNGVVYIVLTNEREFIYDVSYGGIEEVTGNVDKSYWIQRVGGAEFIFLQP